MKKILAVGLILSSLNSQAGWIVGSDHQEKGVLRLSYKTEGEDIGQRLTNKKVVLLEVCKFVVPKIETLSREAKQKVCTEISSYSSASSFYKWLRDTTKMTGSALFQLMPLGVGGTLTATGMAARYATIGERVAFISAGSLIGAGSATAAAYGSQEDRIQFMDVRYLNLIRMYDFKSLNSDEFLTDNNKLLSFPDDTTEEILNSLL